MIKEYSDIEFNKIPTIIERYSFASKMIVCQELSAKLTSKTRPSIESLSKSILPHELEAFFAFSIMHKERDNKDIREKSYSMVNRILVAIDKESVKYVEQGHFGLGHNYMQACFPVQAEIQSDARILFVRHYFYFSFKNENVDMAKEFLNKFGVEYKKIIAIAQILNTFFSSENTFINRTLFKHYINIENIIAYCFEKGYISSFVQDRDKYINEQKYTCANNAINKYCAKENINRNNCFGLLVFCERDYVSQIEKYENIKVYNKNISDEDYRYTPAAPSCGDTACHDTSSEPDTLCRSKQVYYSIIFRDPKPKIALG